MSSSPDPADGPVETERKPELPPVMQESFDRRPHHLSPLPDFAPRSAVFNERNLPPLPPQYDTSLAAIITAEPGKAECDGDEIQTWGEGKYTIFALAERGKEYMKTIVGEKVQDLAPGPQKDMRRIREVVDLIMRVETLALLACTYAFPICPSLPLPTNRVNNARALVEHAADMFAAYIGAMRVPYTHDPQHGSDMFHRLDKYLDDLISPKVWVKLDDLVKQRHRGEKFGQQQLLDPTKKSLLDRMTRSNPLIKPTPSTPLAAIENTVERPSPVGPSLLNSPSPFPASLHGRPANLPARPRWLDQTPTRSSSSSIGPMRGGLTGRGGTRQYDSDKRGGPSALRLTMGV